MKKQEKLQGRKPGTPKKRISNFLNYLSNEIYPFIPPNESQIVKKGYMEQQVKKNPFRPITNWIKNHLKDRQYYIIERDGMFSSYAKEVILNT